MTKKEIISNAEKNAYKHTKGMSAKRQIAYLKQIERAPPPVNTYMYMVYRGSIKGVKRAIKSNK